MKSVVLTSTRKDIWFVTSSGRLLRIHSGDVPPSGALFDAGNSVKVRDFLGLDKDEQVVNMISLESSTPLALGTAQGVVKRVNTDWPVKPEFEVIALKSGDTVIGAFASPDSSELVFISSDAQLLRYPASLVRPQGRPGAGMAGINLDGSAKAIYFGVIEMPEKAFVLTVADNSDALRGTDPGSAKISQFSEFPAKGRATGGVRSHKFIRSENELYFATVVEGQVFANAADGIPIDLPDTLAKRDASGVPLATVIAGAGQIW
jgi:DNA gyrase subunit A